MPKYKNPRKTLAYSTEFKILQCPQLAELRSSASCLIDRTVNLNFSIFIDQSHEGFESQSEIMSCCGLFLTGNLQYVPTPALARYAM